MTAPRSVFLDGQWRSGSFASVFRATDPLTGKEWDEPYPVSSRNDIDLAVSAGADAAEALLELPAARRADFLECYAARLEGRAEEIVASAHAETALAVSPRLRDVELPRTTDQLRRAASSTRDGSWALPTIDTSAGIRSRHGPLGGPVVVFGPNNFPLAFNSAAGGDFAAAIAAGSPVIAKANTSHPATTRILVEEAVAAVRETRMPASTVQLLYRMHHDDGRYLVAHPRLAATGYTGSRAAGLRLKAAADAAGKPIYLELSSVNPVFLLRGALEERGEAIAEEYVGSVLLGTGQFCTNPGIVVLVEGGASKKFVEDVAEALGAREAGPLLGPAVEAQLDESVRALLVAGADLVTGGSAIAGDACRFENTLLRVRAATFLERPEALQREAFGNAALVVVAADDAELVAVASVLEGNLTGSIYSDTRGGDDALAARVERGLRRRVGRLLNDKMPTGVAVSPAMNHGGPFPATGHPGFTAVGMPAAIRRFTMLECYDNVREHRLPPELRDRNPTGGLWRLIDGQWTTADVAAVNG